MRVAPVVVILALFSVSCVWTSEIDLKTFNGAGEANSKEAKPLTDPIDDTPPPNLEEQRESQTADVAEELEAITSTGHGPGEEARRKKKSATTFCVEIRPSGPEQKPFQVCEQAGRSLSPYPQQAAYDEASTKHLPEPKPTAAAYTSNAVKTFPVPTKPAYPTHETYTNYRSGDRGEAKQQSVMRSSDILSKRIDSDDDDDEIDDPELQAADTANKRASSYNPYGSPHTSYVPMVPHQGYKHHGHNGLVITCQPNLAGYAHNVPSSYNHPHPSYQYRSSTPRHYGSYGSYGRPYQNYKPQQQPYGAYKAPAKQPSYQAPAYKAPVSDYKAPTYSQNDYKAPAYSHSDYKAPAQYKPQATSYQQPAYHAPAPTYQAPASSYQAPAPSYQAPASSYQAPAASYQAPAPAYHEAPAPSYHAPAATSYKAPAYETPAAPTYPSQSYQAPAYQAPSYSPSSYQSGYQSAASYTPPGTYRSAGETAAAASVQKLEKSIAPVADDKKEQTVRKMEEVFHEQAARSTWANQMAEGKSANPPSIPDPQMKEPLKKPSDTNIVGDNFHNADWEKSATPELNGGGEMAISDATWKQRETEAKSSEAVWKQREAEPKIPGTDWKQRETEIEMPRNAWKQRESDTKMGAETWNQREADDIQKGEEIREQSRENQVI